MFRVSKTLPTNLLGVEGRRSPPWLYSCLISPASSIQCLVCLCWPPHCFQRQVQPVPALVREGFLSQLVSYNDILEDGAVRLDAHIECQTNAVGLEGLGDSI